MRPGTIKKPITSFFTSPRFLGPSVFVGIGAYKTYQDYQKAKPERKSKILLKDTAILAGSVASFALVSPLTKAFCNTSFFNLFLSGIHKLLAKFKKTPVSTNKNTIAKTEKFIEYTEYVVKESIAGTINMFAGVLGAVYSNEFMHKYVFSKPPFSSENDEANQKSAAPVQNSNTEQKDNGYFKNSNVFSKFSPGADFAVATANRMLVTLTDYSNLKVMEKPMMALTGFNVADTKGYHNKLKKTTYELLANSLIPTIFVSAMSIAVKNKKPLIKYPALFVALSVGAFVGEKVADKYKQKIYDTIDALDLKRIVV